MDCMVDILKQNIINSKISNQSIIKIINSSKKIFIVGAGRSGLVGKFFGMRLMHLGKEVYIVGETITPKINKSDLLIAISNSGLTKRVLNSAKVAFDIGAKVLSFTSNKEGILVSYSSNVVFLDISSSNRYKKFFPLGSGFELTLLLLLESIISDFMQEFNISDDILKKQHTNLE